jgi:hypothetical protein
MSSADSPYVELDVYSVHLHAQSFDAADAVSKAYVDGKFTELVDGAPSILDTLKEISDALGNDNNLAATLTSQISNVQSALTQEVADRSSADGAHDNRLYALEYALDKEYDKRATADTAHDNSISLLNSAVSQEQTDRAAADSTLSVALATETDRAVAAEATKFDKSDKYSKGDDGSFTVADQSYLYIGPYWRIVANSQNEYDSLTFEHQSKPGTWSAGLPIIKRKPYSKGK